MEFEEVRDRIKHLDEATAKSLLMTFYSRLDTEINGRGGDEYIKQTVKELFNIYSELPKSLFILFCCFSYFNDFDDCF